MIRSRLLLATVGVTALLAAGCAGETATEVSDPLPPADQGVTDGGAAGGGAAGACLEGAEDCQDTGGDMGAPPPDTPVSAPAGDGDQQGDAAQAEAVEPTDGLEDLRPVGWETVEVDPGDQTQVTVYWWSGVEPCNALSEVEVAYGEDAVTLTVVEGTVPADEPQACIEIAQYKQTSITLDEEVGPRSILDGAEG